MTSSREFKMLYGLAKGICSSLLCCKNGTLLFPQEGELSNSQLQCITVTCEKKLLFKLLKTSNQLQNVNRLILKRRDSKNWDLDKKGELRALDHT